LAIVHGCLVITTVTLARTKTPANPEHSYHRSGENQGQNNYGEQDSASTTTQHRFERHCTFTFKGGN